MRTGISAVPPEAALYLACLAFVCSFIGAPLKADPNPPANGLRPKTEFTADADPQDDDEQQPAILEQWNRGTTTRNSLDQVMQHLSEDKNNVVARKNTDYPGGGKATRETTVMSKLPGKRLLSDAKDAWGRDGKLKSSFRQLDTLNDGGVQVLGERSTWNFTQGRLSSEIKERWDPDFKGWLETYGSATTYYANGDLKRRVVKRPPTNKKTEEDWGFEGARGRKKTTRLWDDATQRWIPMPGARPAAIP